MGARFLVVEDDPDGEFLIERALIKRFPKASVQIFGDADDALKAAKAGEWTGIVVHRALDVDGVEVVRRLRRLSETWPIVMVSGRDQESEAAAAGATRFMRYMDWQHVAESFPQNER